MISSIEDTIYETVAPGNMQCKFVDTNHCFSGDVTEKEWTYYEHCTTTLCLASCLPNRYLTLEILTRYRT